MKLGDSIQFLSFLALKLFPERWKIQTQEARIIFRANNDENWGSSRRAKGPFEIKLPLKLVQGIRSQRSGIFLAFLIGNFYFHFTKHKIELIGGPVTNALYEFMNI